MLRIIDGVIYEGKKSDTRLLLRARQLGDHREVSVVCPVELVELDAPESILQYWRERLARPKSRSEVREAEQANAERVRRRRVTEIRRRVKVQGADVLLTVTYRQNQTDLSVSWGHWKEFVRRVRRVLPGFSYTVAWEQQTRGAWHAHAAVRRIAHTLMVGGVRVKSVNLLRSVWRSVTGPAGGNIDLARGRTRSRAKIAAYMSKYLSKSMQGQPSGANLWSSSSTTVERPVVLEFARSELLAAFQFAAEWASEAGYRYAGAWVAPWGDTLYIASEDCP